MPLLAADPVLVEPAQREALEALVRAHSTSQQGAGGGRLPPSACRSGSPMRRARARLRHTPPTRLRGDRDDLREAVGE
jgi:hypothetical protein